MANAVSIYENAKHWIAQYESVDEVKQYIDKAAAVQEYAKRANDYEMEHQAARARVRAERRCGELVKVMKTDGELASHRPSEGSNGTTLKDIGLTKDQSSKYQQLANVPESEFEDALAEPAAMPSAHGILNARKPNGTQKRINKKCLYLWGRFVDLEKEVFGEDVNELIGEMTPAMRLDSERILPLLLNWLQR